MADPHRIITTGAMLAGRRPAGARPEAAPPPAELPAPRPAPARHPADALHPVPLMPVPAPGRALMLRPGPPGPPPRGPFLFARERDSLRAGIRHRPSGTMTIAPTPLRQVMAELAAPTGAYAMRDRGQYEAVVVDWRHRVCAAFWA